ncbi:MAG TPA: bifunctional DNA-formamidopyrimidine glycosylase/DNA-(apurinic or apyrimidinic site) lyase, partial [Steroidobacteraceae bacterium]|nr:bifunctional DNA-formamidopyrimidine glycosylase/DNA-(apurinic or apyrimidinic site) lyase [Steroidobacteraceae bacterium]
AVVSGVTVTHADVLRETTPADLAVRLVAARIRRSWRRAKLIVLDLSTAEHLVVQPRFTGALLVDSGALALAERRYTALALHFVDGRTLHYRDIRRLGTVALMGPDRFATYTAGIGPEPLDPTFTADALRTVLSRSGQAVKKVLMNQRQVAGVGNIYATESLWRAGIDPSRSARRVAAAEAQALRRALIDVLSEAIEARGTSFRDYRDAHGERGSFGDHLAAYGRAGLPCPRCQSRLVGTHAVDGRMTVFCPRCQR